MNHVIEKKIGYRIHDLRVEKGFTQDKIAAMMQLSGCDITRSAIAKIEVGQRHLYLDELLLIRQILDVSYEDILAI